ncbi:putative quinol monooxygenase [Halotalea alkalilenta]|uniref:ABM domain-containing protein n=1 Tax=Halotalea alkalilenta TaxID=376489 RepID=A0A172YIN5_9GAMM|nr:putative quinol monooxygenase [Halotalea alkalilenta]ANF59059.1 hypothetical protein A5892_17620 [Halotalea alkalilenta]
MGIGVITTIVAKPGYEQEVEEALREVVPPSRIDDGCEFYALNRDFKRPSAFYILEQWRDQEAISRREEQSHFKRLIEALEGKIESMEAARLETLL